MKRKLDSRKYPFPTAAEVQKDDIDLGEINAKLLHKIEELYLYIIEQDKRIEKLERRGE